MRRDSFIRVLALIGLCALVYYFSYDQGRRAVMPKISKADQVIHGKERVIQKMGLEIQTLKDELAKAGQDCEPRSEEVGPDQAQSRFTVRLNDSRTLFENKLVVACLDINRVRKEARIQINMLKEKKLLAQTIGLGQGVGFVMGGGEFTLLLEKIHNSFVTVKIIRI